MLLPLSLMSGVTAATIQVTIVLDEIDPLYTSSTANIGTVTYDELKLTGLGEETLKVSDASFDLVFDEFQYIPADDTDPSFPEFYFTNGALVGLGFEAVLKSTNALAGSSLQLQNANVFYGFNGSDIYKGHLVFSTVPEPSSILLFIISGILFCSRRKRMKY